MKKESKKSGNGKIYLDNRDYLNEIIAKIAGIKNVKAVYLFGSYATDSNGPLSDIDLCVLGNFNQEEEKEILRLNSDKLDISLFNELPIYIKFRVFREGKPLIVKDQKFVDMTKVFALRDYLDFEQMIIKKRVYERFGYV